MAANEAQTPDIDIAAHETCEWTDDGCYWESECAGGPFQFTDDGPDINGFRFCPYCGKPLKEGRPYDDE